MRALKVSIKCYLKNAPSNNREGGDYHDFQAKKFFGPFFLNINALFGLFFKSRRG